MNSQDNKNTRHCKTETFLLESKMNTIVFWRNIGNNERVGRSLQFTMTCNFLANRCLYRCVRRNRKTLLNSTTTSDGSHVLWCLV